MSTAHTTITVTDHQDYWIADQVRAGRFDNYSDLIRREQQRNAELEALRQALIVGEKSGEPQSFDFAAFMCRKLAQFGA